MAEEQAVENVDETKASPIMKVVFLLGVVLVPAIAGILVYQFFLKGKLATETEARAPVEEIPPFPEDMQTVLFDDMNITVQMEDPELMAPLLIIQVALSCQDQATAATVEARKEYFAAEILNFHQGRTRAELNDTLIKNSILEQIKQQSNILLKRLAPKADLAVLKAMYLKYTIIEMG